jgi:hypothetical protein
MPEVSGPDARYTCRQCIAYDDVDAAVSAILDRGMLVRVCPLVDTIGSGVVTRGGDTTIAALLFGVDACSTLLTSHELGGPCIISWLIKYA